MKYLKIIILCCFSLALFSCNDDEAQRKAETVKAAKVNDSILKIISSNWRFNIPPINEKVSQRIAGWNEWHQFEDELMRKPTGSLTAYRQKAKTLVTKGEQLLNNIPPFFDKPQIRARIGVLNTKIKSLYTYINIAIIPDKKVVGLINEITHETTSLQSQFTEMIIISEIPKEMGEDEMLRALDTVRMANPDAMPQPQTGTPPQRPGFGAPGVNRNQQ